MPGLKLIVSLHAIRLKTLDYLQNGKQSTSIRISAFYEAIHALKFI